MLHAAARRSAAGSADGKETGALSFLITGTSANEKLADN